MTQQSVWVFTNDLFYLEAIVFYEFELDMENNLDALEVYIQ